MTAADAPLASALATYAWLDGDDPRLSGLSLTLVRPAGPEALIRLRPTRTFEGELSLSEAGDQALNGLDHSRLTVQVDDLDGWTALIEPFGWAGATPVVLARLSAGGGRAVNVYWNVNALMHVGWADDGRIVASFDPLLDDRLDGREPEEADLPFGNPRGALQAAFVLVERLTGVRIERAWLLERARPTSEIPVP
jgi:hypothetical protein